MNRRNFLKALGVGAGAAMIGSGTELAVQAHSSGAPDLPRDQIWHILNRIGFGPRPGQLEAVRKQGIEAYIAEQMAPEMINVRPVERMLDRYLTMNMHLGALLNLEILDGIRAIKELDASTLLRAVYSKAQLYEVMVNFWSEHFSIWHFKDKDDIFKTIDDRYVIRKFAMGKFRDLLYASAKSPAMLFYLDNTESVKEHPNENYARELMELHTLTIGNYTEKDVKEVARCFTGWGWAGKPNDPLSGFSYLKALHDDDEKTVLGHTIPAGGGIKDGEMVLDIVASHPATANHIASKLARRFIADDPPENVVKDAAQTFLKTDGDIKEVLKTIFASQEFLNAPPKYKRPFEYVISMLRALNVSLDPDKLPKMTYLNRKYALVKAPAPCILDALRSMGHLPFNHITPDGYTDYASLWQGDMLERWNAALKVTTGQLADTRFQIEAALKPDNIEFAAEPALKYFANLMYGRDLTAEESTQLIGYLGKDTDISKPDGRQRFNETIALMIGAPAFQWR